MRLEVQELQEFRMQMVITGKRQKGGNPQLYSATPELLQLLNS
jgi:hypothetical protein